MADEDVEIIMREDRFDCESLNRLWSKVVESLGLEGSMGEELNCMDYVCYRDFHGIGLCGEADVRRGAKCLCINGYVVYEDVPICLCDSEIAHMHFIGDDGDGLLRGDLISDVLHALSADDWHRHERRREVLEDPICRKYTMQNGEDSEGRVWNHGFYMADAFDLAYICDLIDV